MRNFPDRSSLHDNPLNLIGPDGLRLKPRVVVNNAFGFGGINAALVLAAVEGNSRDEIQADAAGAQ